MGNLVNDPFDVLNAQNKDDIIKILSAVRKGVEGGSISVKDTDKSLASIDETIETLDNFIALILDYATKKKKLDEELGVFDTNELKKSQDIMTKANNDKEDTNSKIQTFENEISEIKKNLPHILMDIESKLQSISATKYRISV